MEKIVTKDWLKNRLLTRPCPYCIIEDNGLRRCNVCENSGYLTTLPSQRVAVLGRALVAIWNNQTKEEKDTASTVLRNGRGFTGPNAKLGSRAAETYLSTNTLPDWLARVWLKEKNGYPRICKYASQLNVIANVNRQGA